MSVILMHTLKSMGKRPVQTAIIVVSVVITAACIVLMLAMPDIFFDCYVLISGRAYGSAQYYFEVVIGDGTKDYHDIFPVLDRAFGDEWCAVIDYGEVAAKTESFNLMCEIYIADDLDRFNSLNDAVPCAALPEEELPEGYAPVCVSEFFTEKSGLSLGDTFSVVPVGNAVVAAVMPDNGHYFSHPYPKLAVQRGLDTVLAPTFSVRVTTPVDRDTALRTADEIAAAGFRVSEHDDVGSYAEDFAEERTAENMPAVLVAGILIIVTMVVLLRLSCTSVVRARSEELVRFKAAGATPAQCMAILLGETTVYTLVGGLVGLGFGKLLIDRLTSGFRIAGFPQSPTNIYWMNNWHTNRDCSTIKDATETEAGNREYWHCADCGRYFLDAALTKETTLAAVTIPAKGQEPVETHTVTLVLGTGEPNRTIEVADGEALTQIAAPTYPGYTFLAWYADADLTVKYDLAAPVTGDLTLYAGWTKDGEKDDSTTTPEKGAEKEEKSDGLAETGDATLAAPVVASAAAGVLALATARRLRGRDEK